MFYYVIVKIGRTAPVVKIFAYETESLEYYEKIKQQSNVECAVYINKNGSVLDTYNKMEV